MVQMSVQGSSDRRTPRVGAPTTSPNPTAVVDHPQQGPGIQVGTSRVPGLTRNSGWRAVNAEIVRTRPGPRPPGPPTSAAVELPAEAGSASPRRA